MLYLKLMQLKHSLENCESIKCYYVFTFHGILINLLFGYKFQELRFLQIKVGNLLLTCFPSRARKPLAREAKEQVRSFTLTSPERLAVTV